MKTASLLPTSVVRPAASELDAQSRWALYTRSARPENISGLLDQEQKCRRHIARLAGDATEVDLFSDAGVSGLSETAPQRDRLLGAVRSHAVDIVVVSEIERVARSTRVRTAFLSACRSHGVAVHVASLDAAGAPDDDVVDLLVGFGHIGQQLPLTPKSGAAMFTVSDDTSSADSIGLCR